MKTIMNIRRRADEAPPQKGIQQKLVTEELKALRAQLMLREVVCALEFG